MGGSKLAVVTARLTDRHPLRTAAERPPSEEPLGAIKMAPAEHEVRVVIETIALLNVIKC